MKLDWANRRQAADGERLARIFLKPLAGRYAWIVWLADLPLRLLSLLFGPGNPGGLDGVTSVLVFDPGALGDMIMLAPFLRRLRESFPASWIALAGRAGAGDFLQEQGMVDECLSLEIPWAKRQTSRLERNLPFSRMWRKFFEGLWQLRKRQFDLGFATGWGGDIRGNLAIWLAGAHRRVGYGYCGGKYLLTDVVEPDLGRPHVADRNLQLLEHLEAQSRVLADSGEKQIPRYARNDRGEGRAWLEIAAEDARAAAEFLARHGASEEDLLMGCIPGPGWRSGSGGTSGLQKWRNGRRMNSARRSCGLSTQANKGQLPPA